MRTSRAIWLVSISVLAVAFGFKSALPQTAVPHPATPGQHQDEGYIGSSGCRSCHPSEYDSWHRTFHRTMTRPAADLSWDGVRGPRLPEKLELYGRSFVLRRTSSGKVLVRGPDLHAIGLALPALSRAEDASDAWKRTKGEELFRSASEAERELVLITGSHHYLAFWLEGGSADELRQLPFVYLLEPERWVPREEAFLQPPDAIPFVARWNSNCIQCHAVAGQPHQSEGYRSTGEFWQKYETRVADLGISCEACHGPGSDHAEYFRNPLRRMISARDPAIPAAHIFNPEDASAELGASICGQCHSYFLPKDPASWWETGFSHNFRAGDTLTLSRWVIDPEDFTSERDSRTASLTTSRESLFWADGSMMIGGREYNGLIKSPCFERGHGEQKMTCMSCHSMHKSDPNRQIAHKYSSLHSENEMCTQCHSQIDASHSRHLPDSEGSRCVACHMPRTSYALLQGTRSHRITSPQTNQTSPPNACVLCHVNSGKSWFDAQLRVFPHLNSAWPEPSQTQEIPWAAELALAHNAATRAILADALGRDETIKTSGSTLSEQVLPLLKDDTYKAVSQIAARSLRQIEDRKHTNNAPPTAQTHGERVAIDEEQLRDLLSRQDLTPIVISE